ncbi:MAG TPA: DNA-formamidopyrimidine glycosylase family protein [Candidatus Eisenbacteria bacterium]
MPELPDIVVYCESLTPRIVGATFTRARVVGPNLLRTVEPPLESAEGRTVRGVRRLGKRIVIALQGDLFLVLHLMIAGRLHWRAVGAKAPGRTGLAAFEFSTGTLLLTEAAKARGGAAHARSRRLRATPRPPGGVPRRDPAREPHAQMFTIHGIGATPRSRSSRSSRST